MRKQREKMVPWRMVFRTCEQFLVDITPFKGGLLEGACPGFFEFHHDFLVLRPAALS